MKLRSFILFFILTASLVSYAKKEVNIHYTHTDLRNMSFDDDNELHKVAVSLALEVGRVSKENIPFKFEYFSHEGTISFVSYNTEWILCLNFNSLTRECHIQLFGMSDTFDEQILKMIADFHFMYN